jgi:hypothetical protein
LAASGGHSLGQVPHLSNQALEGETMNKFAVWFGRLVWLGIAANFVLAIPGLLWPEQLLAYFRFPPASPPLWPSFASLLLILLSLFYMPGAINPYHYRANAYLAVISRLAGVVFFLRRRAPTICWGCLISPLPFRKRFS